MNRDSEPEIDDTWPVAILIIAVVLIAVGAFL